MSSPFKIGPWKLFTLVFACLLSIAQVFNGEDRRINKSTLVIMTLNAEFLWDGVEPEEGQVRFSHKFSKSEAEDHMKDVAEIIIKSNPDIVNLVEVENIQALKTFNSKFLAGRGYLAYLDKGTDSYTGQDVGLLTRIDPEGGEITRDGRTGFSGSVGKSVSKNYVAKFTVGETKIALIGLHFLAIPTNQGRKLKRQAQADAVRAMAVEKAKEGYQVVVLGDFNDYEEDADSRDHIDSLPITNALRHIRWMERGNPKDDLINVVSRIPKANRYTAYYDADRDGLIDRDRELTSIDHILLSKKLEEMIDFADIPHEHDPRKVTDHFPVVVRIRFPKVESDSPETAARIVRLLPNPEGDETEREEVTIKNVGKEVLDLSKWKLRDLGNKIWSLKDFGKLEPGQEKTIKRNGQTMSLNNRGDTIELIDPKDRVIHSVTYGRTDEEEEVIPSPN